MRVEKSIIGIGGIVLSLMFLGTIPLFAWGIGHDYVNRGSIKIMPKEIKNFIGKKNLEKFVHWSHAPDCMVPLLKDRAKKKYPITDEEIVFLKSFGAKCLYYLHSTRKPGQAGNFILLVKAFMDKDPARSAFWMSTLMHTVADDAACNHTSQIHYLTYAFRNTSVKMGKGIGFDFGNIVQTDAGEKAIAALLAKYKPHVLGDDPADVISKILYNDAVASTYATRREFKIVETYTPDVSNEKRKEGVKAMAELGVYGMEKTMDLIVTAWKFAKQDRVPKLTKNDFKKAERARREYLAKQSLSDDSIYTGLLRPPAKSTPPVVGVLLERSGIMMSHRISYGGRLVMAAAMRTMKKHKIPYATIDLRDLGKKEYDVLNVSLIPVIVICSGPWAVSKIVKNKLREYVKKGGRLLWIGGSDGKMLGDLSKSLRKADPTILPATKKYGCNNKDVIDKIRIRFLSPISSVLVRKEYSFINNPDTTAGSQKPVCLLKIDPLGGAIKPLVELLVDDKKIVVAAALMNGENTAVAVFVPEYLIAPFLLDKSVKTEMVDVANIKLDKVGAPLFLQLLKLLGMPGE